MTVHSRNSRVCVALAALGLGVVVLTAYVLTLAPGLLMNDSGEFQTLGHTLGHTHPTGYPIYLVLTKAATFLPVQDVAYRVNLFSAICGTAAAIELFLLAKVLTGWVWLPWVAALALAASPTFWSQAIIAEVYAPAAAFLLGVVLCLALWQTQKRPVWLVLAGVLGGMSLGVHLSVALFAPAAIAFVALERQGRMRTLAIASAGAMGGALVTLAAFALLEKNNPPSNYFDVVVEPSRSEWGLSSEEVHKFWPRLKFSLSARQFKENLRKPMVTDLQTQAADFLRNLPRELPVLVLLAAAAGFVQLVLRNGRFASLLLISLALQLAYVVTHNMGDIQVAYIPIYLVVAICSAAATGVRPMDGESDRARSIWWERGLAIMLLAAALWPGFQEDAWTPEGRRTVWVPKGEPPFRVMYSEKLKRDLTSLVSTLEDDAVLFTDWDLLYPCYYVAHVEERRTGIRFIQTYPAIGQQELAESARELIREMLPDHPVYILEPLPELANEFAFEPTIRGGWTLFRLHPLRDFARRRE